YRRPPLVHQERGRRYERQRPECSVAGRQQEQQHGHSQQRRADDVDRLVGVPPLAVGVRPQREPPRPGNNSGHRADVVHSPPPTPTDPRGPTPRPGRFTAEPPQRGASTQTARARRGWGMEREKRARGPATTKPAPRPSTPRDTATTGIEGPTPPITLAAANS